MQRPSASADHWSGVAPSKRMMPRAGFQTPTSARASDDLPEPLGPMTPSADPAASLKVTPCSTAELLPGGAMLSAVTRSDCEGRGSSVCSCSTGALLSASESMRQACRADTKERQLAIASSTGASAREVRMLAASMTPALAS